MMESLAYHETYLSDLGMAEDWDILPGLGIPNIRHKWHVFMHKTSFCIIHCFNFKTIDIYLFVVVAWHIGDKL